MSISSTWHLPCPQGSMASISVNVHTFAIELFDAPRPHPPGHRVLNRIASTVISERDTSGNGRQGAAPLSTCSTGVSSSSLAGSTNDHRCYRENAYHLIWQQHWLLRTSLKRFKVADVDLRRSVLLPLVVIALLSGQLTTSAGSARTEHLDRGLVAATTDVSVHLSWRLLGHEATGATATGSPDGISRSTATESASRRSPVARPTSTLIRHQARGTTSHLCGAVPRSAGAGR
ncbi:MAG: hypothetical protein QOF58_3460 [Pseudonocardiales bacterium]|jgi:hypothetical protein|nr:hypothetical protein [Pseudonocardiales bacterium]